MNDGSHVQVRVMNAVGLRAVNAIKGNSDPYAVLSIPRTGETRTTTVCLNTCNPYWYHNIIFSGVRNSDALTIRLYDKNLVTGDVDLGTVQIPIGEALSVSTALLSEAAYQHDAAARAPPPPPPPPPPPSLYIPNAPIPQSSPPVAYTAEAAAPGYNEYVPSAPPPSPPPLSESLPHSTPSNLPFNPQIAAIDAIDSSHHLPLSSFYPPPPPPSHSVSYDAFSHYTSMSVHQSVSSNGSCGSALRSADVTLQRAMTRSYPIARMGSINVVVAPGWVDDLATSAPRNHFKRFQTHKFAQQVGNIGKMPFQNKVGASVGKLLKSGAEMAKPLHPALDLLQPVHAAFQEHSTWKIDMHGVSDVFGEKRHGWNRDYPAAQKIFHGTGSVVARKVIQMQHAYLYGGASGIKPLVHMRKDLLEITGNLLDAQDFLNLMEYGIRRGKSRMFTYVLMPDRLYAAETGAKFFRDMMSKHAMHCSASPEVVYAGELHFRRAPPGSHEPEIRLIVDNNSGTYAPGKEDLPRVEEVFRRNFPGLQVTALDFKDPLLEQYRQELPPSGSAESSQLYVSTSNR